MGTTRIKVIDLASDQKEIKTARKHAEKLTGVAKLKAAKGEPRHGREEIKPKKESEPSIPTVPAQPSLPSELSVPSKPSQPSISSQPRHRHHLGKLYAQAAALVDRTRAYPPAEALDLLAKTSYVKFDPTVEIHLNVGDKNLRGSVTLPHPVTQKKAREKKYLIFSDQKLATPPQARLAKGGSNQKLIFGDQKTIEQIAAGTLKPNRDFDQVLATPKFMPLLAKIAKILGPAGMMPNPKNGTIIEGDVGKFFASIPKDDDNKFEYKTDPNAPIIHSVLGKLSDKPQNLSENLKTFIASVGPTKITKAVISSTMGPGIKLDISSL